MSSYEASYGTATTTGVERAEVPVAIREEFPAIATVLAGVKAADGQCDAVPAATINLFCESGRLKFCIIPKFGNRIAFGSIESPEKGFTGLEEALQRGHYEWKISKRRN